MEAQIQNKKVSNRDTRGRPIMVLIRINATFDAPSSCRHLKELMEHSCRLTLAMDEAEKWDEIVKRNSSDDNRAALQNAYMRTGKCAKEATAFLDRIGDGE